MNDFERIKKAGQMRAEPIKLVEPTEPTDEDDNRPQERNMEQHEPVERGISFAPGLTPFQLMVALENYIGLNVTELTAIAESGRLPQWKRDLARWIRGSYI